MQNHPSVELAVPVYNERADLERSVARLRSYLDQQFPFQSLVTIADNGSTDGTYEVALRLASQWPGVRAVHLDQKGRGGALRAVWSASELDVVAYTDVDLSTCLDALVPLVAPLVSGLSDLAIGSRLAPGSRVVRSAHRDVISRCYNLLVRLSLGTSFSDAQCGFKAMRSDVARALLPHVLDDGWFFDTELLALAQRSGLRIVEVPVEWIEDRGSTVRIVRTAIEDVRGLARLRRQLAAGAPRIEAPVHPRPVAAGARSGE